MTQKEIFEGGLLRNPIWVKEQVEADKIFIVGSSIKRSEVLYNQYKILMRALIEVYPDTYDIIYDHSGDNIDIKGFSIYFPVVNITNTAKYKHTIKDLYIHIRLQVQNGRNIQFGGISASRGTMDVAEVQSDYVHSHISAHTNGLTGNAWVNITKPFAHNFCTGSGEINIYKMNINAENLSENNVYPFLLQLQTLADWESTEGTPYRHIRNIRFNPTFNSRGSNIDYYRKPSDAQIEGTLQTIIMSYNENPIDLDVTISNSRYQIVDNDKIQKFVEQGIRNYTLINDTRATRIKRDLVARQLSQGVFARHDYVVSNNTSYWKIPNHEGINIKFRGEIRPFRITDEKNLVVSDTVSTTDVPDYVVTPEVRTVITNILTKKINNNAIIQQFK